MELAILRDIIMVLGVLGVVGIAVAARLKIHKMRFELHKAGGLANEDREAIRDLRASVQRIEERLEALETLAMEREREEKFGMRL
jgi:hypothetical protein